MNEGSQDESRPPPLLLSTSSVDLDVKQSTQRKRQSSTTNFFFRANPKQVAFSVKRVLCTTRDMEINNNDNDNDNDKTCNVKQQNSAITIKDKEISNEIPNDTFVTLASKMPKMTAISLSSSPSSDKDKDKQSGKIENYPVIIDLSDSSPSTPPPPQLVISKKPQYVVDSEVDPLLRELAQKYSSSTGHHTFSGPIQLQFNYEYPAFKGSSLQICLQPVH